MYFVSTGQHFTCPLQATLHLITNQWNGVILWLLTHEGEAMRYGALKKSINRYSRTDISDKMLSQSLRQLQEDGLIQKQEAEGSYRLTATGEQLEPILSALEQFGLEHLVVQDR